MFKRLKRLYQLSKKDKDSLEEFMKLTDKEIDNLPDEDQKAVFIGSGTEDEYKDFEKEEKGLKAWYKRLENL